MDIDLIPDVLKDKSKYKTSFNFSIDTITNLEEFWFTVRKLSGSKQISKSLIMEVAFCIAYAEFCEKKEHSQFYKDLIWFVEQKED